MSILESEFIVERHGGRRNSTWRRLYIGNDENRARRVFDKQFLNMRQGGLILLQDNEVIDKKYAPTLRTIW